LSLAISTYFFTFEPSRRICSSICTHASLAPPWSGPHKALIPAEIDANKFASDEPTIRTVEVLQFCSWSACTINSRFSAFTKSGSTVYGSLGTANIIRRKCAQYDRSLLG